MRRKRRKAKKLRVLLLCVVLFGVFALSYKGYKHFFGKQTNNVAKQDNSNIKVGGQNNNTDEKKEAEKKKQEEKEKEKANSKKNSNVNEEGKKYAYDVAKVRDILDGKAEEDGKKIAFLTFDDGPSTTVTPKVLKTLKEKGVKATFFFIGESLDKNNRAKELVKRIHNEGHAIGNHTYSHSLKKLYPNRKVDIKNYMEEMEKTNNILKDILGQEFNTRITRMPGGEMSRKYYKDPNLQKFREELKKKDMYSIDWNALNQDAEGKKKNAAELLQCAKKTIGDKDKIVILMHDTYGKEQTAKALPNIIDYLKEKGYEFKIMQ